MMKRISIAVLMLILASLLLVAGCATESETQESQIGNPAPEFNLLGLDGDYTSLNSFMGEPVLLYFWATWCESCRTEMSYFQQIYDEWTDKGLVLLTINVGESLAIAEDFAEETGITMPVLVDHSMVTHKRYQITGMPTTYLIDKDGIIKDIRVGSFPDKQTIEQNLSKIMP